MNVALALRKNPVFGFFAALLWAALTMVCALAHGQDAAPTNVSAAAGGFTPPPLAPLPPPMDVPKPGPTNDAPYAPQALLPGGVVVTLFPAGSHYLNMARIREAEVYTMDRNAPGRVSSIVNIHNPSIEMHTVSGGLNTGAAVILAAGGGHNTLNVGTEACDFVPFFFNYGVNTIILRNRLRRDGYNPRTDEVYDALQAIKMVRAHAADWHIDPNKIGIMGFSAGAELAAPAAIQFEDFDRTNDTPDNPLAKVSSRPDFVGIIYPGPSPFTRGANPPIPRTVPPAFLACAGSGDQQHAVWADEYFAAMLAQSVPNIEMHIYARGYHPGSGPGNGAPNWSGGLTDRLDAPYGTWQFRFIDWFRDLGFLEKPGVKTRAAIDSEAYASRPQRGRGGFGRQGGANIRAGQ